MRAMRGESSWSTTWDAMEPEESAVAKAFKSATRDYARAYHGRDVECMSQVRLKDDEVVEAHVAIAKRNDEASWTVKHDIGEAPATPPEVNKTNAENVEEAPKKLVIRSRMDLQCSKEGGALRARVMHEGEVGHGEPAAVGRAMEEHDIRVRRDLEYLLLPKLLEAMRELRKNSKDQEQRNGPQSAFMKELMQRLGSAKVNP